MTDSRIVSRSRLRQTVVVLGLGVMAMLLGLPGPRAQSPGLERLNHVIVIYQENWSFDSLYGQFPGADGLANAGETVRQTMKDGIPYAILPPPLDTAQKPPVVDTRFPANMPVRPFDLARYARPDEKTGDLVHRSNIRSTAARWIALSRGATTQGSS